MIKSILIFCFFILTINISYTEVYSETEGEKILVDSLIGELFEDTLADSDTVMSFSHFIRRSGFSGLHFVLKEPRLIVSFIKEGSLAFNNGLEPGDQIIAINNIKIDSIEWANELARSRGDDISITVVRGFEILEILITNIENEFTEVDYEEYLKQEIISEDIPVNSAEIVDGWLFSSKYSLNNLGDNYERVVLYYNTNKNDHLEMPAFILDGKVDDRLKIKKITGNEFTIGAKDLSDTFSLELNSYEGKVYIKHDGGYYYGESITPGKFDLRKDNKVQYFVDFFEKTHITDEYISFKGSVDKRIGSYLSKGGISTYKNKLSKLQNIKAVLDTEIETVVQNINSEEDFKLKKDVLIKYYIVSQIIKDISEAVFLQSYYLKDIYSFESDEVNEFVEKLSSINVQIAFKSKEEAYNTIKRRDPGLAELIEQIEILPLTIEVTLLENYNGGLEKIVEEYEFLFDS